MDLEKLLGDQYRADMTSDEIVEALKGMDLVAKDSLPASVDKTVYDKTASELAEAKRKLKEKEAEGLSAEQQLQQQLEERESTIKDLQRDLLRTTAHERLAKLEISDTSYIDSLIDSDVIISREILQGFLDGFEGTISSVKKSTEKNIRADVTKNTPKPPTGDGEISPKERFDKMSISEKMEFATTNPEEYKLFSKK